MSRTQVVVPFMLSIIAPNQSHNFADKIQKESEHISFLVITTILNTIIAPVFATLIISPQCLRYIFITPDTVETSVDIPFCWLFRYYTQGNASYGLDVSCAATHDELESISYVPPYEYTYQCSGDLLGSYAGVWVD